MDPRCAPALYPALGLVLGASLAPIVGAPVGVCALLAALGLALRRPVGLAVACLALGFLNADIRWQEPRDALGELELHRPAEWVAEVTSHPLRRDDELLLRIRTLHAVQGSTVRPLALDVLVTVPNTGEKNPVFGARVRLKGYLRQAAEYANTGRHAPGRWRIRLKSERFLSIEQAPGPLADAANGLRSRVEKGLAATEADAEASAEASAETRTAAGEAGPALVRALLLGDRDALPQAWRQALRRLGLSHLLAVSGLHVGLVVLLVLTVTSPLPRRGRLLLALAGVLFLLALVGPRPSVLRAGVMGSLALAALLLERPPQLLNALAAAIVLMVLQEPSIVADLGFRLSVAATTALIVFAPRLDESWSLLPRTLRAPLGASILAQLATLPFLLPLTGTVHPTAPFYNLVAVPWLGLVLLVALPWLAIAVAAPSVAADLLPVLDAVTSPLPWLADRAPSSLDLLLVDLGPFAAVLVAGVLGGIALRPRRGAPLLLGLLLLAQSGAHAPEPVELVALDVGQGDAFLLRDGRRSVLIDGGGWPQGDFGGRVLLPALAAAGVKRLDAVLLTHADLDHCGGLADLVRYLPVPEVWTARLPADPPACARRLLAAPGVRQRVLVRGDTRWIGRIRIDVLHPDAGDNGADNDLSLVILAEIGTHRILLTGDVEAHAETLLVRRDAAKLRADVLKVAHHGSKSSTSAGWLDAVAPRLALISAGPTNPYGHPAPVVLERLEKRAVPVLRTDLLGRFHLRFHQGGRIEIVQPVSPRRRPRVH